MDDFIFDGESPLVRAKGETLKANDALGDYYRMGPGRSLRKLAGRYVAQKALGDAIPPTASFRTLVSWSTRYAWQSRVEVQTEIDQEAERIEWERRQSEIREREWTQSSKLVDLADQILAEGPNFIKTRRRTIKGRPQVIQDGRVVDPGEPAQVIVTMALDGDLAIKATKAASELGRLAAGLSTSIQDLKLSGSVETSPVENLEGVDDDQLAERLRRAGRLSFALADSLSTIEGLPESGGDLPGADPIEEGGGGSDS